MEEIPAAILAGGEATRMGSDKAFTEVGGLPLLARAWNALAPGFGPLLLQGRSEAPPGLIPLPDGTPGLGPLGGLVTFLDHVAARGAPGGAVLALDLPGVSASVMVELFALWSRLPDRENRVVILEEAGRLQPLAGVYGSRLREELKAHVRSTGERDRSVVGWLASLDGRVRPVPVGDLTSARGRSGVLANVNAPADIPVLQGPGGPLPPMVTVLGWKDSGKTTVAVGLAAELGSRGYRVMAMKHGHGFRLDTPGTDSYRLRHEARSERVLLSGPEGFAVMGAWADADVPGEAGEASPEALAATFLSGADVVVAEGWKRSMLPAVEVMHRDDAPGDPESLCPTGEPTSIRCVARCLRGPGTGSHSERPCPTFELSDPAWASRLADAVETRVLPGTRWAAGREG